MENSTITASTPQEFFALYTEAFNAADVDNIMSLNEPNAVFVYQPNSEPAQGIAAIRQVMKRLLTAQPRFEMQIEHVLQANDVALVYAAWKLTRATPEGGDNEISGKGTDIVRRQANNAWLFVVDNPFGISAIEGF